ncbi:universal stress protein [Chamaesiphon sp. VAR_48_metabat_403]|uniref:universal stress protein n=1 Tax=Chamaesiphon sp. VAR_48_metabat_403 TaxID=2964700 RepID=UPI00286DBEDF|nr:universal stress protein [Chamaesiphon sp. VAR_48_metabat_403]
MLQKILIATGDSPESAEVFKSGLTLAEKYGAQISILQVLATMSCIMHLARYW